MIPLDTPIGTKVWILGSDYDFDVSDVKEVEIIDLVGDSISYRHRYGNIWKTYLCNCFVSKKDAAIHCFEIKWEEFQRALKDFTDLVNVIREEFKKEVPGDVK